MIRYFIIEPLLDSQGLTLQMPLVDFFMLSLSTMMIAAAGYLINDYFDIRIDKVNKPDSVVLGKYIDRRSAILGNIVFNTISVCLGIYLSFNTGKWYYSLIYITIPLLLLLYSAWFKRKFFIGNLIVALFSAIVPFIVWVHEVALHPQYLNIHYKIGNYLLAYTFFAFLVSMMREIVKDVEDIKGDKLYGCTTMPIILGVKKIKQILFSINIVLIVGLGFILIYLSKVNVLTSVILSITLLLPSLIMFYFIFSAKMKQHFSRMSLFLKIIMILGILSLITTKLIYHAV